jgi:cardiolipin synthase
MALPFWILGGMLLEPGIRYVVAGMAIFASFTDILDGYIARKYNQVTEFGKIIDPLADKIAIAVVVIRLFMVDEIPEYYFYMIIGRDVLIFFGGIFVSKKLGRVLPSNMLGKLTVTVIGLIILMILFDISRSSPLFQILFYFSIVLIFSSIFGYVYRAAEYIRKETNGNS